MEDYQAQEVMMNHVVSHFKTLEGSAQDNDVHRQKLADGLTTVGNPIIVSVTLDAQFVFDFGDKTYLLDMAEILAQLDMYHTVAAMEVKK